MMNDAPTAAEVVKADVVLVDDTFKVAPNEDVPPPTYVKIPLKHQFRPFTGKPAPLLCRICGIHFDNHWHAESYLQKVIAQTQGKDWKHCTFAQRQKFKDAARHWFNEQVKRILSAQPQPRENTAPQST